MPFRRRRLPYLLVSLLLLSWLVLVGPPASGHAEGVELRAFGNPYSDGWSDADRVTFGVNYTNRPNPYPPPATLEVLTDGSTLYLRLYFEIEDAPSARTVRFFFDNDHDGSGPEEGDDVLVVSSDTGFADSTWSGSAVVPDTDAGGTNDGAATMSGSGSYTEVRIWHDLDSGDDANDFSLSHGDVVGFHVEVELDLGSFVAKTQFPASGPTDVSGFGNIEVAGVNTVPVAAATATPTSGPSPLAVQFDGTASYDIDKDTLSYEWTIVDSPYGPTSVVFGTASTAQYQFSAAGEWIVDLLVSDTHGGTSIQTLTVTVEPPEDPVAVAGSDVTAGPAPLTVQFDGTGSYDPGGTEIEAYTWDFGDGSPPVGDASPTHQYTESGVYVATLRVEINAGQQWGEDRLSIVVGDEGHLQVENLRLAEFPHSSYRPMVFEDLALIWVLERDHGHTDLNGDGDDYDNVVHVRDFRTGTTTNLGLQCTAFLTTDGRLVPLPVSEAGVDRNGDGDRADVVAHVYDPATGQVRNLGVGVRINPMIAEGQLVLLGVHEPEQGVDLNGDGDTDDTSVVHLYDAGTDTLTNLGIQGENLRLLGGRAYFHVDGVLHRYDPATGVTTSLDTKAVWRAHTTVLFLRESTEGKDLNGDGDTSDQLVYMLDVETGTVVDLGFTAQGAYPSGGRWVPLSVYEQWQGADLNGDGDRFDWIIRILDTETGDFTDLPYAYGGSLRAGEYLTVFRVSENGQGLTDLNGDGDTDDGPIFVYDARTGEATNLERVGERIAVEGDVVAFLAKEEWEGDDLNGDGDTADEVLHSFDARTGLVTNLRLAAADAWVSEDMILAFADEAAQLGADLNADGDAADLVAVLYDVAYGEMVNAGLAVSRDTSAVGGNHAILGVVEAEDGPADRTGDGDAADHAVFELSWSLAGEILLEPETVQLGPVPVHEYDYESVSITNIGGSPLTVTEVSLDPEGSSAFRLLESPPIPWTLAPGESVVVRVEYAPTSALPADGQLMVRSDDPRRPVVEAPLTGVAREALSHYCSPPPNVPVTPVIDGSIGEWVGVPSRTFAVTLPDGGTATVRVAAMNDEENLYLLVTGSIPSTSVNLKVYFDNDHDGHGPEVGDDLIALSGSTGDAYWDASSVWIWDIRSNGSLDAEAAYRSTGCTSTVELRKPLDSGDPLDFSLASGDTIGYTVEASFSDPTTGTTRFAYPAEPLDYPNYGYITIAGYASPTVTASGPLHVAFHEVAELTAAASHNVSYSWTQTEGPEVHLDPDGPRVRFRAPQHVGSLVFEVTATDAQGGTDSTSVEVTVLEDTEGAIFVSDRQGSDSAAGSFDSPVQTIGRALEIARTRPREWGDELTGSYGKGPDIYVEAGNYTSDGLHAEDGVSIYGGFVYHRTPSAFRWTRTASGPTEINRQSTVLVCEDIQHVTVIDGLTVRSRGYRTSPGGAPGLTCVAVSVLNCGPNLWITNNTIIAGNGEPGSEGQSTLHTWAPAGSGDDAYGDNREHDYSSKRNGGLGGGWGSLFSSSGLAGGCGGLGISFENSAPDVSWENDGGYGGGYGHGSGGLHGYSVGCPLLMTTDMSFVDGRPGEPGSVGEPGRGGTVPRILVVAGTGAGPNGSDGSEGGDGSGGGGGGAGGVNYGLQGNLGTSYWWVPSMGGGGGGEGGKGGLYGGGGGGGGGGCVGIRVQDSSPLIRNNDITTVGGGDGGDGGDGTDGALSGEGGAGGSAWWYQMLAEDFDPDDPKYLPYWGGGYGGGGDGGAGGRGGGAGGGAGGTGGPSIGILIDEISGESDPMVVGNAFDLGPAGQGGEGGEGGSWGGIPGEDGQTGLRTEVLGEFVLPIYKQVLDVTPRATVSSEETVEEETARAVFLSAWAGSDVEMSLTSPSGVRIDRATIPPGVTHSLGPTFESYAIENPEPGAWLVELYGADVPAGGEEVVLEVSETPTNELPIADAGEDQTLEATGPEGVIARLDGSRSSDPDGFSLSYEWTGPDGQAVAEECSVALNLPLGEHVFTLTVRDEAGGTDSDAVVVEVVDRVSPRIVWVTVTPETLWPPNHEMVEVTLSALAADLGDADATLRIVSITSDEPVNGPGDGDTSPDWEFSGEPGDLTAKLRAERSALGDGRKYRIDVVAEDDSGNVSGPRSVFVYVPHDEEDLPPNPPADPPPEEPALPTSEVEPAPEPEQEPPAPLVAEPAPAPPADTPPEPAPTPAPEPLTEPQDPAPQALDPGDAPAGEPTALEPGEPDPAAEDPSPPPAEIPTTQSLSPEPSLTAKEIAATGASLTLSDGTVWLVATDDQATAKAWKAGAKVKVEQGSDGVPTKGTDLNAGGTAAYRITNLDVKQSVLVTRKE